LRNTELLVGSAFNNLLFDEVNCYNDLKLTKSVIYSNKVNIESQTWNYINSITSKESEKIIKPLIDELVLECERLCPGMGNVSLNMFMSFITNNKSLFIEKNNDDDFNKKILSFSSKLEEEIMKKSKSFHYQHLVEIIKNDIGLPNQEFIIDLIKLMSVKTKVFIDSGLNQKSSIKLSSDLTFDVSFDTDFIIKEKWEESNYNFIIIDGFIDSLGEIYHLLTKANESGEPYVVFCKGMRQEVKNVIMQNLLRGTINIMPISLDINELNVNILADIAVCHNSDIVTHLKGDTISAAVRRSLSTGNKITVTNRGFTIKPVASQNSIRSHVKYLEKRKEQSNIDANTDLLDQRIKIMAGDKIVIKLGTIHLTDKLFTKDLNKILILTKQMMFGSVECQEIEYFKKYFNAYMPTFVAINVIKKVKSLLTVIYNSQGCIIFN
jgi:hypothetical protein